MGSEPTTPLLEEVTLLDCSGKCRLDLHEMTDWDRQGNGSFNVAVPLKRTFLSVAPLSANDLKHL